MCAFGSEFSAGNAAKANLNLGHSLAGQWQKCEVADAQQIQPARVTLR
jgi:hypothetical protein